LKKKHVLYENKGRKGRWAQLQPEEKKTRVTSRIWRRESMAGKLVGRQKRCLTETKEREALLGVHVGRFYNPIAGKRKRGGRISALGSRTR